MLLMGAYWPIKFDVYLLRFPQGCEVPEHTDKVNKGRHYRLNIVLKKAQKGGEFICHSPIFESERIKLFRPDLCVHAVSKVEQGERLLLSIGWVRR
ncbi:MULTISPECIES: 2OG-Fe(II) oxygenase [Pseudoalteromonas]|nr:MULTISPECIES: 2OG-Fe(II) oxygenase [Pseudoalteromonas]MCG7548075.1 2OG-Fe(II) oxygenase [Pseudoalteromonas sp. Of7M-16]